MHAGTVGIEDTRDLDLKAMLAMVVEEKSLGAAFALVVARANANWVHPTPIVLALRMDLGVTVNLTRRRLEYATAQAFGKAKHVDGAVYRGLGRLHRVVLIGDGRGWTGKVVDFVNLDIERKGNVVAQKLEVCVITQVLNVPPIACEEIVDTDDFMTMRDQPVDQMRAKKSGAAGY
jgi:hypothetical protein